MLLILADVSLQALVESMSTSEAGAEMSLRRQLKDASDRGLEIEQLLDAARGDAAYLSCLVTVSLCVTFGGAVEGDAVCVWRVSCVCHVDQATGKEAVPSQPQAVSQFDHVALRTEIR